MRCNADGSGAIRLSSIGPVITLGDLRACFPFDDSIRRYVVTGASLRQMFAHFMRPDNRDGEGECYQVNTGVRAVYNDRAKTLESLEVGGRPVEDCREYTIAMNGYHADNCTKNLNITPEELTRLKGTRVIATSATGVLEEYLQVHPNISSRVEGRLVYLNA